MDEIFGEVTEFSPVNEFGEFGEFGEFNELGELGEFNELFESGESGESDEALEQWAETLGEIPFEAAPSQAAGLACADSTYANKPWQVSRPGRHDTPEGTATETRLIRRADVRELDLSDFDVDDYRLRPAHRRSLQQLVAAVARGLQRGRIGGTVVVRVFGQASSTATMQRNLQLSAHRAWNTRTVMDCMFAKAGVGNRVEVRWVPVGESLSQQELGDNVERAANRSVRIQVIAPRPPCKCGSGGAPPSVRPAGSRRPSIPYPGVSVPGVPRPPIRTRPISSRGGPSRTSRRLAQLCVTVLSIKRAPGVPIGVAGVVPSVIVRIRVDDHRSNTSAIYLLRGVAIRVPAAPVGMPGLPNLASLFPASLNRFAPAAGQLIQRALQAIASAACTPTSAVGIGANPLRLLGGTAMLVAPGGGVGRAHLAVNPGSPRLKMTTRVMPVRWRGRAPRRHVIVVGKLTLVGVRPGTHRMRREQESGEFGELGEFNEFEFGEDESGEDEFEFGEFNELGEFEFGEDEFGEDEFGEFGEDESGEFGEDEFGEFNEVGEFGEFEFGEDEFGEDEAGEFGEFEFGEFNEDEQVGEHVW